MEVAGFQRDGVCKDDISMVRVKAVFVFSIRLIRTVTGNTWRSRCVPACLRKTCVSDPVYMYRVPLCEYVGYIKGGIEGEVYVP